MLTVAKLQLLDVRITSMVPSFALHELQLAVPTRGTNISVGSVVVYRSNPNGRELVSHRVVAVDLGRQSLRTQGDALTYLDPPIAWGRVTGRVVAVASASGRVVELAWRPLGLVVLLHLLVSLLLLEKYRRLVHYYTYVRLYRLHDRQMV